MNTLTLLSFGFLFLNQINFGMLPSNYGIKDSALLAFQKEAEQDKQSVIQEIQKTLIIEKKTYQHALALDNNQPAEYVARWYKKYRFPKEITDQTIEQASSNFKKHSLKGQQAVIKYSENQQELLRTLLLPQEIQYLILTHLLVGCNTPSSVEKFQKLPLKKAYETLALSKEYAEKTNYTLSIGDWFLLAPYHYETVHKILSNKGNQYIIESSQELKTIRSLPVDIKNGLSFIKCTRKYELSEKMKIVANPVKNNVGSLLAITTGLVGFGFCESFILDVITQKRKGLKMAIEISSLAGGIGLGGGLSLFTYDPLKNIYGKSYFWTMPLSAMLGIGSYYFESEKIYPIKNAPFIFSQGFFLGNLALSGAALMLDNNQPQPLKITKPLDQI